MLRDVRRESAQCSMVFRADVLDDVGQPARSRRGMRAFAYAFDSHWSKVARRPEGMDAVTNHRSRHGYEAFLSVKHSRVPEHCSRRGSLGLHTRAGQNGVLSQHDLPVKQPILFRWKIILEATPGCQVPRPCAQVLTMLRLNS